MKTAIFYIIILLLTLNFIYCADHETFKNCSRIDFCSRLRYRIPENKYFVDPESIHTNIESTILDFILKTNEDGQDLSVSLQILENNTARIKIKEIDSDRYELQDILVEDPVVRTINFTETSQKSMSIIDNLELINITVQYAPFLIEFRKNNVLELVLNGSQLIFEKNNQSRAFAFGISFPSALQLYGIHEHAENLALQNTRGNMDPYRLKNSDLAYYELNSPMAVYGSIPVLYGHGSVTSGIFFHNAAEQWYDILNSANGSNAYIIVESGTLDLFTLLGPSLVEIVRQYVKLTGTPHLPQLWTLGYHQSRYTYFTQDEVKDVISNFDTNNFQMDAIWLDIDYTDSYKYFTWNPKNYSNPIDMLDYIASTKRKLVVIIDPHVKAEEGYSVYDGALEKAYFVKNSNGSVFYGNCWPGNSSWIDFLNPTASDYYSNLYSYENFPNTTSTLAGIWNDMNEPSVYNSEEQTLPDDIIHYNNTLHRDIHNIYGFLNSRSTHRGLLKRDNSTKRPFVLTRSHFAGSQRYAAIWTGDNQADWGYLAISYPECLNANLLGMVFCGADIGGFAGNPDDELFQRWYQAGAWLPFYRAHSAIDTKRREPYLYDKTIQNVIRNAIQLRYKHLPIWYTLIYEHIRIGDPVIRPLFYHYPTDVETFKIDDQLLLGRNILVKAITQPGLSTVPVYFPGGENELWLSLDDSKVYNGNGFVDVPTTIESIPVYYRKGSIIVRKETVRANTEEMQSDPHTLFITLGNDRHASGTVYLDDNVSFEYADRLEYNYLSLDFNGIELIIEKIDKHSKSGKFDFVFEKIIVFYVENLPSEDKPGNYEKSVYNKDINGVLFKNMKFNSGITKVEIV